MKSFKELRIGERREQKGLRRVEGNVETVLLPLRKTTRRKRRQAKRNEGEWSAMMKIIHMPREKRRKKAIEVCFTCKAVASEV